MLNKNQSNKRNSWKYATVLPLLGAFVFVFQVEVVAQEKAKQEKEVKSDSIDLTKFNIEKDLTSLSKGKEIYINGEKSSQEELAKLDPKEIEKIDVAKINNKEAILITPKVLIKAVKITDKEIYIDGVKSTNEEFSKLDQKSIDNVDVDTFENTVRITTKSGKPIVILNGTQTVSNFKIDDIQKDQIESVNVIKGKSAEEKYGSDAKYGAIEIFTKNGSFSAGKTGNSTDNSMIIINGKKAGSQVRMDNIYSEAIKSINVLKGKSAVEKYGKEGENGVVEITTDKPDQIIMKVAIGHPMPKSSPASPVEKKEPSPDKVVVVNGWKGSGLSSLDGSKPLIVVDGKTKDSNFNIEDIPKEQIKKINVFKGKLAEDKYGKKGENGVIEIETK